MGFDKSNNKLLSRLLQTRREIVTAVNASNFFNLLPNSSVAHSYQIHHSKLTRIYSRHLIWKDERPTLWTISRPLIELVYADFTERSNLIELRNSGVRLLIWGKDLQNLIKNLMTCNINSVALFFRHLHLFLPTLHYVLFYSGKLNSFIGISCGMLSSFITGKWKRMRKRKKWCRFLRVGPRMVKSYGKSRRGKSFPFGKPFKFQKTGNRPMLCNLDFGPLKQNQHWINFSPDEEREKKSKMKPLLCG